MTNLAARNEEKKLEVLYALQQVYCTLVCLPLQEDINDIVVGMKMCPRNGIECSNHYCSHFKDGSYSNSIKGEIGDDSIKADDKSDEEDATSGLKKLSFSSSRTWKSSSVGSCESVSRRVSHLVTVIERNGGDVEGLETELTEITMCKTQ